MKIISFWITVVLVLFFQISYGYAEPSESDVKNYLQPNIPTWLAITSIKTKSFIEGSTGAGRTSVALTLITTEPIFRQAIEQEIDSTLSKYNLVSSDLRKFAPSQSAPQIFYIISHQGNEEFTETTELRCQEQVQGWAFAGEVDISLIRGEPKSNVPPSAIIIGTPEAETYLGEIANKKLAAIDRKTKYIYGLKLYFAKDQKHEGRICLGCGDLFPITLTLTAEPQFTDKADETYFNVTGRIHWNGKILKSVANTTALQDHQVLLEGQVYEPKKGTEVFTARISLAWAKENKWVSTGHWAEIVDQKFSENHDYFFTLDPLNNEAPALTNEIVVTEAQKPNNVEIAGSTVADRNEALPAAIDLGSSYPALTLGKNGKPGIAAHLVKNEAQQVIIALQLLAPDKILTALRIDNISGKLSLWRSDGNDDAAKLIIIHGKEILTEGDKAIELTLKDKELLLGLSLQNNGAFGDGATEFRVTAFFSDSSRVMCALK